MIAEKSLENSASRVLAGPISYFYSKIETEMMRINEDETQDFYTFIKNKDKV